MSAPKTSPAGAPAAPTASAAPAANAASPAQAAAPKAIIRRRRPANPLVQKKKPPPRPPLKPNPPGQTPSTNGAKPLAGAKPSTGAPQEQPENDDDYEEFEIKTTKRAISDSLRWHVMRFMTNASSEVQNVDLLNEHQFQRPIRLHRRDPRANNMNHVADEAEAASAADKHVDDKERERLEAIRAEKRAEREALAAQTAPVARKDPPVKKNRFGKKLDQSRTFSDSQDKKKNATIKYEEALPWHIEDFEDNNVWRGTYETALSENHAVLVPEGRDFRLVVIDKWYKFTPKNRFKALSFEQAENAMKKGAKDPLAIRNAQRHAAEQKQEEMTREHNKRMFKRKGARGEKNTQRVKREGEEEEDEEPEAAVEGIDDIDFNYDEDFADDEEGPELVGAEEQEQAKETGDRVKREMREAPVFELREDKDYDAEEEEQKRKAAQERKHRKRVEKALKRREKNFQYDDDSDDNPYASDGDSEDSEIERQKAEEAKLEEEKKAADSKGGAVRPGDKAPAPPVPSKSGNQHSLKPSKSIDPLRKLKRPGSPSMSEASGNESSGSRKKPRKAAPGSSALGEGATISRPGSPASGMAAPHPQRSFKSSKMAEGGAGSGSEVELSDGTRVKKGSKKRGPPTASPDGSRPGSPGAGPKKKQKFDGPLPDFIDQVLASIPPEGVGIRSFIDRKDIKPWVAHPGFMPKLKSKMYSNAGMLTPKSSQQSGDATPTGSTT